MGRDRGLGSLESLRPTIAIDGGFQDGFSSYDPTRALEGLNIGGIHTFLGIPCGKRPVGPLRWCAPEPAEQPLCLIGSVSVGWPVVEPLRADRDTQ